MKKKYYSFAEKYRSAEKQAIPDPLCVCKEVDRVFAVPMAIEDGTNNMDSAETNRPNQMVFGSKLNKYV
jgi:hypothetical protein